jgi:phosphate transport system substrate-binding protein
MSSLSNGRCVNFGLCAKADSRQAIPITAGDAPPACPDCSEPLLVSTPDGGTRRTALVAVGIVALLVLVGLGFARVHFLTRNSIPRIAIPTTIPVSSVAAAKIPANATGIPSAATPSRPPSAAAFTLCGSNTVGSRLGPELVRTFVTNKLGGRNVRVDRARQVDETVVRADVPRRPDFHVDIAAHGSATAFKGLSAGSCQVGMASRRIKPEEVRALRILGDLAGPASEHVLGLDGIAVIVHASNPIDQLGIYQLHGLFTGALTNWAQVGGNPEPVDIYARDDKSGTYDTFASLVLGMQHLTPSARRFEDSTTLSNSIAGDPHGIGFIGVPYVKHTKALRISSGTALPIYPNALTVGRETYPLTRRLYLYTLKAAKPADLVARFVSFTQSDAGQRIVNSAGFVGTLAAPPLRSRAVAIPADAPPAYANLLRTADEVDFALYFKRDSDILDNKANIDVSRLVSLLNTDGYRTRKLLLAGFADNIGDPEYSKLLSARRAETVAAELTSQGVIVAQTFGFGRAVPIRDNATPEGREKNRRVEIFIAR